jgi:hypothetical protein
MERVKGIEPSSRKLDLIGFIRNVTGQIGQHSEVFGTRPQH